LEKQLHAPLYEALEKFYNKHVIPFDVPGHKRGKGCPDMQRLFGEKALALDINSLPEMDNLNHPVGVIKEAHELFAEAFGAEHAFFTVNGTTIAIHAMILSACNPGDKIILPRNIHKSALNALILCDAVPIYMQAEIAEEFGFVTGITFKTAKKTIDDNPDAKAIFLINPTYYGVCSQLKEIIEYAHSKGIAVIVDEAHGAHFNFHDELPPSAMSMGADMAAVSIHKTGGAMTQASAVLLNTGRIDAEHVKRILNVFHTTSPSYLLMTSLDAARRNLAVNGEKIFTEVLSHVRWARDEINKIEGLYAIGKEIIGQPGIYNFDETKLTINVAGLGLTGFEVYKLLYDEYNIQLELADVYNVLAIVSLGDDRKSLTILVEALKDFAIKHRKGINEVDVTKVPLENPVCAMTPRKAFYSKKVFVPIHQAEGRVIAESIMVYPPGIPIVAPGEIITKSIIEYIEFLKAKSSKLTDMNDPELNNLLVVEE
jgi:arginine/lysine/ornithine decarboxylase